MLLYLAISVLLIWLLRPKDRLKLNRFPAASILARTDFWLFYHARRGRRFLAVDRAHRSSRDGKIRHRFLRVAGKHISIADHRALPLVYNHTTADHPSTTKSDFYDAFVAPSVGMTPIRGMFNTRDRVEHARKRKIVSNIFSQQRVREFEPVVDHYVQLLVGQLAKLCTKTDDRDGLAHIDLLVWANYWAFDLIGDLAFGESFGMLEAGKSQAKYVTPDGKILETDAIKTINQRGTVSAALGCAVYLKPYAKYLPDPFFKTGVESVARLSGIAIDRVKRRLEQKVGRDDLLTRLMQGRDATGNLLGEGELTVEALTQLIAGSDTTSNSLCHIIYLIAKSPRVQKRLVSELIDNNPDRDHIPQYQEVKDLPYLQATLYESLRMHATSSIGLPRVVPAGGMNILGEFFEPGTILSVPTHTIHRDHDFWGANADDFIPERWLSRVAESWTWTGDHLLKSFNVFSTGPRACIGRNLALMELTIVIASLIRKFMFELESGPEQPMEMVEGFLVKPKSCLVKYKLRTH